VALILIGVVGLVVSVTFIYLSAPDLALTQISVEVATVILLLLALNFLPKRTPRESTPGRRVRDLVIAGGAGLGSGLLIYALMMRDFAFPTISDYHLANAKTGGGGTNVVNVILVDFRGYDTFGEIIVLGIAALTIFALTEALLRGEANRRLLTWTHDQRRAADRHPLMFAVATRMILPVALMVGVFIFLRGHNEPGGGFIAGLVVAIALVAQYMASGFGWAEARQKVDYHAMIGLGVVIAALTGVGSWLADRPFLTSNFGYFRIPPMEKFELATAMLFDLGVFLTVLGAVMLALASLSRIAVRAGETVNTAPMDVDPSEPARQPGAGA
jgi:multicomponent K+:H+ antiporter subunit A